MMRQNQPSVITIVEKLKSCLPDEHGKIGLHEPQFAGQEWAYLKECMDTGWVSSVGKFVDLFEKQLAEFTGVKRAIAVANGTSALHICLKLAGVEQGDEVLVPALSFVASANAIAHAGGVPHFVDSEERTLGLNPFKLEQYLNEITIFRDNACYNKITGRRIKAVVPMHTFGHPVDMEPLVELSARYNLELVEDAAESLGSYYKGVHTGKFGKISALSFNGNKVVTTGGGGAILTDDEELGRLAKHITTTAKMPHKWAFYHDMVAYNYRMPNLNAALGCAQMEQLPGFLARKRELALRYAGCFVGLPGVSVFLEQPFARSNYWLNALLLDEADYDFRDSVLEAAHAEGIMVRPAWTLLNKLPFYKDCPHMNLSGAENLEARIINIPSSVFL